VTDRVFAFFSSGYRIGGAYRFQRYGSRAQAGKIDVTSIYRVSVDIRL